MNLDSEALGRFVMNYAGRFEQSASSFFSGRGWESVQKLILVVKRTRGTVYAFGNGGSHAIARCIRHALYSCARVLDLPLRVSYGVDVDLYGPANAIPGLDFSDVLKREGASDGDFLLILSGSGNSDNLVKAARFALERSVPALGLIGSSHGSLRDVLPRDCCYCVEMEDQQISEDVIQFASHLLADGFHAERNWHDYARNLRELADAIRNIPAAFLDRVSDKVLEAFEADTKVLLLGLDHPATSACAEHTAHNLNWDAFFEVARKEGVNIASSPTFCDLTGVSNDRTKQVIPHLVQLQASRPSLAILYCHSGTHPDLPLVINEFLRANTSIALLSTGPLQFSMPKGTLALTSGLTEPFQHACFLQIFGHLLGRVVRLKLAMSEESVAREDASIASFLIENDLAQRRRINDLFGV